MKHAVTRVLGMVVLSALAALTVALAVPSAAHAADDDLGWVRLQPATGKTDVAVLALTEAQCPDGRAVTMSLKGPNIPTDNSVGNLVGVTEYKAFDPTLSGQLWIPLSTTFRNWFLVNGITLKPSAPYTLTVVCRDLLRASKTFGTFTAQVVFDAKGGYKALGEAAKPFDTELKPDDPFAIPTPTESAAGSSSAEPSTSADAGESKPASGSSSAEPPASPSGDPAPGESSGGATSGGTDSAVAAPSAPASASGPGALPFVLIGALVAAGAGWFLLRQRSTPATAPTGRRERPPTDEL